MRVLEYKQEEGVYFFEKVSELNSMFTIVRNYKVETHRVAASLV